MKRAAAWLCCLLATAGLFSQESFLKPLLAPFLSPSPSASPSPSPEPIELIAFRYGTSRIVEKAVFRDGSATRLVDFAWLFYALRLDGRWYLIDTGFNDPDMIKYWSVAWTDPIVLLKKAGIEPADIAFVLLTHAHFDHLGLADRFPKARIIMSEAARKDAALHAVPLNLREFFKSAKRVDTFNGKLIIDKDMTMVEIGGHSIGSCIIRLDSHRIVITGDEAYLPENWTGPRGNGSVINAGANLKCLEWLKSLGGDWLILSPHDPAVVSDGELLKRLRD